jgi:uncharacterized surface protein with fasciclin (FAS1) repeats
MMKSMKINVMALFAIIFVSYMITDVQATSQGNDPTNDIVTVAVEAGNFSTLATALTEAGLIETLQGDGPFTVFAPTDEAFSNLPEGTLESLLADKEALKKVLLYHVVSGKVESGDVVTLNKATTVEGSDLKIEVKDGNVMINDAMVTAVDVQATNGVIHVIDKVLIPVK